MALQKKRKSGGKYTIAFLKELEMKDLLGMLTADEIEIARKTGKLQWDLYSKASKITRINGDLHRQGFLLAPIFNKKGEICNYEYPQKNKFLVPDYDALENFKDKK